MGFKATVVAGVGAPRLLREGVVPRSVPREALTRPRPVSYINGVRLQETQDSRHALNGLGELVQVVT